MVAFLLNAFFHYITADGISVVVAGKIDIPPFVDAGIKRKFRARRLFLLDVFHGMDYQVAFCCLLDPGDAIGGVSVVCFYGGRRFTEDLFIPHLPGTGIFGFQARVARTGIVLVSIPSERIEIPATGPVDPCRLQKNGIFGSWCFPCADQYMR